MDESIYDLLLSQGLTEEDIDEVLALGEIGAEGDILSRRLEAARAMRDAPGPRGRGWGRIYRSSHPLETAGTLAQRMVGGYRTGQLEGEQRSLAQRQTERRGRLLRALGRRAQGVTAPGAGTVPGSAPERLVPRSGEMARTHPLPPLGSITPRRRMTPIFQEPTQEEIRRDQIALGF